MNVFICSPVNDTDLALSLSAQVLAREYTPFTPQLLMSAFPNPRPRDKLRVNIAAMRMLEHCQEVWMVVGERTEWMENILYQAGLLGLPVKTIQLDDVMGLRFVWE